MKWLQTIAREHNTWIAIVRTFGGKSYTEDIIQTAYIRLHKYSNEDQACPNGVINIPFVKATLRNTFKTYVLYNNDGRQTKKQDITHFDEIENFDITDSTDTFNEGYELFLNKLDNEINSWCKYDRLLWDLYAHTDLSMQTISEGAVIGKSSIFNTLKNCKDRIRLNCGEDWEDLNNEDFELI